MHRIKANIHRQQNFTQTPLNLTGNDFSGAETFEGECVPKHWTTSGGSLCLSGRHYKCSGQSLLWRYTPGAALTVRGLKNLNRADASPSGGIRGWIYNETPSRGVLRFEFGSGPSLQAGRPKYAFSFGLHFSGWRAFAVGLHAEAGIPGREGDEAADTLRILPPENETGSVHFGFLECVQTIVWSRAPDCQVPLARRPPSGGLGGTWERNLYYSQKTPELPLPDGLTEQDRADFAVIAARYARWVYGSGSGTEEDAVPAPLYTRRESLRQYIAAGIARYEQLGIALGADGTVTGAPLFASRTPYGPKFGVDVGTKIFLPLVLDYKLHGNAESLDKALLLFDYFHDQGWAYGSGLETLDHETLRLSGYFHAVYLLGAELRSTGRFEREMAAVEWFTCFGKTFTTEEAESTADELRTNSMYRLLYILGLEDSPRKLQYMRGYLA